MQDLIDNQLVEAARQLITNAHQVAVITHLSPDGDAMGSSLGMKHFLLSQGKKTEVIVPNEFPNFLNWLPGAKEDIVCDKNAEQALQVLNNADLVIVTDFQEPKRCGEVLGDLLVQNKQSATHRPVIMIDHHLYPSDMADVTISYSDCASASELVYRLIRQLQSNDSSWHMSHELATCIYTGMMTDTGNFQYNSNHPDMYEIVAELMRAGVDKDECYDKVFNQFHTGRLRLVGYCLYRKMRTFPKNHVALIALSSEELKQFNFQSGDAEGIVNMPMQIGKIYYSCFMREDTDKIKISFRSQGDRPVNTFAHDYFNGGGHKNAAGGEFYGSLQDAVKTFMEHYEEYCH